jgi:hypothetical protein
MMGVATAVETRADRKKSAVVAFILSELSVVWVRVLRKVD